MVHGWSGRPVRSHATCNRESRGQRDDDGVVSGAHDWLSQASVCPGRRFLHRLSCEENAFGVNKRRFGQKDGLCNILILPPSLASNLVGPDNMSVCSSHQHLGASVEAMASGTRQA